MVVCLSSTCSFKSDVNVLSLWACNLFSYSPLSSLSTSRQLEAVIRIAESLAKMKLQAVAGEEEVDEALRLFQVSTLDAALSGSLSGVLALPCLWMRSYVVHFVKLPYSHSVGLCSRCESVFTVWRSSWDTDVLSFIYHPFVCRCGGLHHSGGSGDDLSHREATEETLRYRLPGVWTQHCPGLHQAGQCQQADKMIIYCLN